MSGIGILAYGSLIAEPGPEIGPLIQRRITTKTPFPVEYARLSRTRGGAPTVTPHSSGVPVNAEVLVLCDATSLDEAKSLLWRRETRKIGSGRVYRDDTSSGAVVVRDWPGFCNLEHVLYTDFNSCGKLEVVDPRKLATAAVNSVARAAEGKDGISYLMDLISAGVVTALTSTYESEILRQTGTTTLAAALNVIKTSRPEGSVHG